MKRIILTVAAVLLLANVQSHALDWKKFDAEVINTSQDGQKTTLTLKDRKNKVFKVIYQDETMLEKVAPKINKYKKEFYDWREIIFTDISFMVFDDYLEVIIMPREIAHNQTNLAKAIPAGITMLSPPGQEKMHYDFRIIKGDFFLRIEGDYLNEEELIAKLRYAYDYPLAYLRGGESGVANAGGPGPGADERARQALLYFLNEDWNGRPKSVPPETINKVIELKVNNPWMSKAELWKTLKREKVKITKREFELILIIYFNEFEF